MDLEDYFMWHYEYKAPFNKPVGQLAQIELGPPELYGKWGPWFAAVDWVGKGVKGQNYTLAVHYETVRSSRDHTK
eukprot:282355-Prorocentrum_minimum.AAC.1